MPQDIFCQKYANIFENSGVPIFTVNKNGYFEDINEDLCRLFEGSKDDILKKPVSDYYVNPEERRLFLKELQENKILRSYHIKMKSLKGKTLNLIISTKLWPEDKSNIMHHGIAIDASEILYLRNKLINLEKYSYLTEVTKKIGGDISKSLDKILEIIDEMIMKSKNTDENYGNFLKIESLAENALEIASGYSADSKNVYKPEEIEICSFITKDVGSLADFIPENIKIETELKNQEILVISDFTDILKIINGVVMNAVEAFGKNGGDIKITVERVSYPDESSGNKYASITVTDNAGGMDEETLSRIFEPFFTTKENSKGMGLKNILSILKKMKGEIFIESKINGGTKVKILIPVSEDKMLQTELDLDISENQKILFVDDDDFLREAVSEKLRNLNFNVSEAGCGKEAIQKLRSTYFDILILDMMMPDMTGWEVYKQALEIWGHLPVIFVSGYTEFEHLDYLKNIYKFISKPFKISELVSAINDETKV